MELRTKEEFMKDLGSDLIIDVEANELLHYCGINEEQCRRK